MKKAMTIVLAAVMLVNLFVFVSVAETDDEIQLHLSKVSSQLDADSGGEKAFDGDTNTSWHSAGGADKEPYIEFILGDTEFHLVSKIEMIAKGWGPAGTITIYYSKTAIKDTELSTMSFKEFPAVPDQNSQYDLIFGPPIEARFIRIYYNANSYAQLQEIKMYGVSQGDPVNDIPVLLTPSFLQASSDLGANFTGDKSIDGDPDTQWHSYQAPETGTPWIDYMVGTAKHYAVTKITLTNFQMQYADGFEVYYSEDPITNTNVGEADSIFIPVQNGGSGMQTLIFDTPLEAKYIRIYLACIYDGHARIAEMEMFGVRIPYDPSLQDMKDILLKKAPPLIPDADFNDDDMVNILDLLIFLRDFPQED